MYCPACHTNTLDAVRICNININQCHKCGGIWFDRNELKKIKDKDDEFLSWFDIDLFSDRKLLDSREGKKKCPRDDNTAMQEVQYGKSDIKIDICRACQGIWLDGGEYEKLIAYLRDSISKESVKNYLNHIGWEVEKMILGRGNFSQEAHHFVILLKLFEYRIASQWPELEDMFLGIRGVFPK